MKCSFCEQPLVCKECGKPFHPRSSEAHVGAYQPDTALACPECQKQLVCQACGFIYAPEDADDDED